MGSSQTRARTRVPCIGRQILNHCATREALKNVYMDLLKLVANLTGCKHPLLIPPSGQQKAELCPTDPPLCREGFLEKDLSLDYPKWEEPKHGGYLPELQGSPSFAPFLQRCLLKSVEEGLWVGFGGCHVLKLHCL